MLVGSGHSEANRVDLGVIVTIESSLAGWLEMEPGRELRSVLTRRQGVVIVVETFVVAAINGPKR